MLSSFRFFARLLDSINIATCFYDNNDQAVLWNRAFFKFFPEHAGHIYEGEPYSENLRRFYVGRLEVDQMPNIDRYIDEGIARHRSQFAPYTFSHRGNWIKVTSLPIPAIGRMRVWVQVAPPPQRETDVASGAPDQSQPSMASAEAALINDLADGIALVGKDGRILSTNGHFLQLYGFSDSQLVIGRSFSKLYEELWTGHQTPKTESLKLERSRALEESIRFAGAPFEVALPGERWIRIAAQRAQDGTEYWLHTDISLLKIRQKESEAAEQRARKSEALYRLLADYSGDVIVGLDAASYVRYVSPSIYAVLGYQPDELLRQPWYELRLNDAEGALNIDEGVHTPQAFQALHKAGRAVWVESSIRAVPDKNAIDEIRYVIHLRDISLRKQVEMQLQRANADLAKLATVDSLTGLANRRILDDTIDNEWRRARRERTPLSLLLIDIDNFKTINDHYGHQVGDICLVRLAAVLRNHCRRPADLCARYGGEEFIVVLPNTEQWQAEQIAKNMLLQASQIRVDSDPNRLFSISIGQATISPATDEQGWRTLIHAADEALYVAKRTGKNRIVTASASESRAVILQ